MVKIRSRIDRVCECESRQLGLVHRDPTSWVMLRIVPHNSVPRSDKLPDQSEQSLINLINLKDLVTSFIKIPSLLAH